MPENDITKYRRKQMFGIHFSNMLAAWKKENNKTDKDFCKQIGISKNLVKIWKDGAAYPQEENLKKICAAFGVSEDFFNPYSTFDHQYLYNNDTVEKSRELEKYAEEKGIDWDEYNSMVKMDNFLRLFPFHEKGISNSYFTDAISNEQFPLVRFEFEDSNGFRKMMCKEDIDFILEIQEQSRDRRKQQFARERTLIRKKRCMDLLEWNLKHYDIDREEVEKRLYKIDFLSDDFDIVNEEKIERVFQELAKEKHIQPHISRDEIAMELPELRTDYKAYEKNLKLSGLTDDEIEQLGKPDPEKDRNAMLDWKIQSYINRGFIIDDSE